MAVRVLQSPLFYLRMSPKLKISGASKLSVLKRSQNMCPLSVKV